MRRLHLILVLTPLTVLTVWHVYDFFVTNEGVRYYSSEPRRLVYVLLIALAGGVTALGVSRLSSGTQRALMLVALGAFGSLLLWLLGLCVCLLASFGPLLRVTDAWGWIAAGCLSLGIAVVVVWLMFRHVWRQP